MNYSEDIEHYLVDLWHPSVLPGGQEPLPEIPDRMQGPTFKLTGWRGAGWRIVFLDEPAE